MKEIKSRSVDFNVLNEENWIQYSLIVGNFKKLKTNDPTSGISGWKH